MTTREPVSPAHSNRLDPSWPVVWRSDERPSTWPEQRRFFVRVWLPLFAALQVVAVALISSIEPEGFDRCTAAPSSADQRVQVIMATPSLAVPLGAALIWLRRRYLLGCFVLLVLPALIWLVLLSPTQSC